MKKYFSSVTIYFLLSWLIWIYCFYQFLEGKFLLQQDAVVYYEHFKYFIDQISRGVYPLWDSVRDGGVPNEFFLRRIGSFNPLNFLILFLQKIGFPYKNAYYIFLALYYFLGMLGFYKMVKVVLKDQWIAFTAYLLFMFSSLVCLLVNSFIILEFTPMVWFFYFLFSFTLIIKKTDSQGQGSERKEGGPWDKSGVKARFYLVGMVFCVMLLLTTYVPFYFMTILLSLLALCCLFYPKLIFPLISEYFQFLKQNKAFSLFCLTAVLISLIPGVLFYQESARGEFVLPMRHQGSQWENPMTVAPQMNAQGGIVTVNFSHEPFSNLDQMRPGIFYIPVFVYILFLLGSAVSLNRRLALLAVWFFFFYIIGVYNATPLYRFLYDHVFFFKYYRNFQFFLWLVLLPTFIFVSVEHLKLFFQQNPPSVAKGHSRWLVIGFIHLGLAVFLFFQQRVVVTSYVTVGLSFIVFVLLEIGYLKNRQSFLMIALLIVVLIQPVEVYHYLERNVLKDKLIQGHNYDSPYYLIFKFGSPGEANDPVREDILRSYQKERQFKERKPSSGYLVVKHYYRLMTEIKFTAFKQFISEGKLTLYDNIEYMDDEALDLPKLTEYFVKNINTAFVNTKEAIGQRPLDKAQENNRMVSNTAEIVTEESGSVRLISFDLNSLKLKTHLNQSKFLVYKDAFYTGWQASVDDKPVPLYRANIAFKGVWVPQGEHMVCFKFGEDWRYALNFSLLGFFVSVFCVFLWHGFNVLKIYRKEVYENLS